MKRRFPGIFAVLGLLAIGLATAYSLATRFSAHARSGRHLVRVEWLPASASDVSYYDNGDPLFPMYCYECVIPFGSVTTLAREKGWLLREKSPVDLPTRVSAYLPREESPVSPKWPESFASALEYHTEQGNGGGLQVVYHRPSARLFVYYSAN